MAVSCAIARWGAEGLPHIVDEMAALFQAKLFAAGYGSAPLPPELKAFTIEHLVQWSGAWHSKYAPLWALSLAPWQALDLAWLWSPLLAAATVLLLGAFARRSGDAAQGAWAAALLAGSPQFLLLAGMYFNHVAALLCACARENSLSIVMTASPAK